MRLFKKKQKYGWLKSNKNWEETKLKCVGYDDPRIAKAGLNNAISYEVLNKDLLPYPIICYLIQIARNKSEINVIDFGGGFGLLFKKVLKFIADVKIEWNVIEQESYVNLTKDFGKIDGLKFYDSIDKVLSKPNVVIISGVLQYLDDPQDIIQKLIKLNPQYILINRLPVFINKNKETTITIQKVAPEIYGFDVSYPCWIFNENDILKHFNKYDMIAKFYSAQDHYCPIIDKAPVDFIGYFLELK